MPTFTYKALDPTGQETTGTVSAQNRGGALDDLSRRGLVPVSLAESSNGQGRARPEARSLTGRVSQAAVEAFSRELANLLAAGVPMNRGLKILCREASSSAAKKQWMAIHDDVAEGIPLAEAMARWPKSFPLVYVAMVRAGETGGFLDVVLMQIADFRSRERDLKSKVRSSLAYPTILAVLSVGVLVFLLTYFIPRFSGIFAGFGAALPPLTRAIVAVSRAVTDYGLLVLLGTLLVVLLVRRAMKSPAGRLAGERLLLRTPGVGKVLARFALVRFCRMLGTLLGAGVPLVSALRVARETLGQQTLANAVNDAVEEVQQGRPLARSLSACRQLFPPSVVEMIAVAEETGRLDLELKRLAGVYEEDLDRQLRLLVAMAEPALLFVMAAVVGAIVVGMLLPVFTLQEYIR